MMVKADGNQILVCFLLDMFYNEKPEQALLA